MKVGESRNDDGMRLGQSKSNADENLLNDCLKFFPTLDKLVAEAEPLEHNFFIARDHMFVKSENKKWIKQFTSFPNARDYLEILSYLSPKARTWNEIIRPEQVVKPVFDIEWYQFPDTSENNRLDPEEGVRIIWDKIRAAFRLMFDLELTSNNLRILESHKYTPDVIKFSYHIIIHGYRLKNLRQYAKYLTEVTTKLIKEDHECRLNKVLNRQGKLAIPIDVQIYKANQGIRMLGHHKQDEVDRFLKVPSEMPNYDPISYLVTETETEGILLDFQLPIQVPVSESIFSNIDTDTKGHNREFFQECLELIDIEQLNRLDWIKIGMALRQIFGEGGLDLYQQFSKRSTHYEEKGLLTAWRSFKPEGKITGGTLIYYVQKTNPEQYRSLLAKQQVKDENLLDRALNMSHHDVSLLVTSFLNGKLLCCDGYNKSQKLWYYYLDHRWVEYDGSIAIGNIIKHEILIYLDKNVEHLKKQSENKEIQKRIDLIGELILKLKTVSYINNIVTMCRRECYKPEAYNKFDENHDFLGCNNGVFDLKNNLFREGHPDDLITMSTKIDYLECDKFGQFDDHHPHVVAIDEFFRQIQPDERVRKYLQTLLGSCLLGRNIKEQVYLFEGCGSNGKTKLFELLGHALGVYFGSIAMSFFTGKKASSGQANPEVEAIAKTLILTSSETDKGDTFNLDILKKLSGNDKITYRGLNRPIKETVAPFTILFAVNHLPKLPEDDRAIWRRIRVIQFKSQFVDNPDCNDPNQFKKNEHLSNSLFQWRHAFLWLLIKWHQRFRAEGLPDIPQVLEATQQYQTNQDPIKAWLLEKLEITGDRDDYVYVKLLKEKLLEGGLYRNKFKKDRDFVEYLIKMYPSVEYVKELVRIKTERVRNVLRCMRLVIDDELDCQENDEIMCNI